MRIRNMKPGDVEEAADLLSLSFSDPWSRQSLEEIFLAGDYAALAAEEDGLIGLILMKWVLDEGDITTVAVHPSRRKEGIGKRLVEEMQSFAEGKGICTIFLEVRESNRAARTLYEHAGFSQIGRRERYYRHPEEDAVLMRWDLPEKMTDRKG